MTEHLLTGAHLDPEDDPFVVDGRRLAPGEVYEALQPFLSEARQARIAEVLAGRTYTVATVVEGLVDTGNVSAVMRSAEGLGYQGFHVITQGDTFKHSRRTTQGADKWLDLHYWDRPSACADHLRAQGYRIAVTHLDDTAVPLSALDFTQKTALVFGNEARGVTDEMIACSDVRCIIPMTGFAQSFNISVAAAVSLFHAYQDRLRRQGFHGDLTEEDVARLRALFAFRSVKKAPQILARREEGR